MCAARSSSRLLLILLFLAPALGSYAQVTISETDSQQLKSNLLEVRTILTNWGESLNAGEIVLAGSFTRPVPAKEGDMLVADYGKLGTLRFRFV